MSRHLSTNSEAQHPETRALSVREDRKPNSKQNLINYWFYGRAWGTYVTTPIDSSRWLPPRIISRLYQPTRICSL
jgi:hypothetical protein